MFFSLSCSDVCKCGHEVAEHSYSFAIVDDEQVSQFLQGIFFRIIEFSGRAGRKICMHLLRLFQFSWHGYASQNPTFSAFQRCFTRVIQAMWPCFFFIFQWQYRTSCNCRVYKQCTGSLPRFQLFQSRLTKWLIVVENIFRQTRPSSVKQI